MSKFVTCDACDKEQEIKDYRIGDYDKYAEPYINIYLNVKDGFKAVEKKPFDFCSEKCLRDFLNASILVDMKGNAVESAIRPLPKYESHSKH